MPAIAASPTSRLTPYCLAWINVQAVGRSSAPTTRVGVAGHVSPRSHPRAMAAPASAKSRNSTTDMTTRTGLSLAPMPSSYT